MDHDGSGGLGSQGNEKYWRLMGRENMRAQGECRSLHDERPAFFTQYTRLLDYGDVTIKRVHRNTSTSRHIENGMRGAGRAHLLLAVVVRLFTTHALTDANTCKFGHFPIV